MASNNAINSNFGSAAPLAKPKEKDLAKYLAEEPSRHVCARTWLPPVHVFQNHQLLYNENAYDRYKYTGTYYPQDMKYDQSVHSQFTQYLTTIPHDESVFLRWIKDLAKNFKGNIEKTRRATMHPELNKELLALRASYPPNKPVPLMLADTEFFCDEESFFQAEAMTWAINYKKLSSEKLVVGLMDVELIQGSGMICGPRRFYVRRLSRAYRPHHCFTVEFKKFVDACVAANRSDAFPPKQEGLLVLYDQRRDTYSSVIVVQNKTEDDYVLVYETETGRVVQVSKKTIDDRLRAVPEDFDGWVIPESIPVELADDVSFDEWQEFYNNLVENGKIYITAVDGYKLKVTHFEEVRPQAEPHKIYCRNIYCLGKCAIPSQWRHPPEPMGLQSSEDSDVPRDPTMAQAGVDDEDW